MKYKTIDMDVVLLRILSYKSILDFGKYNMSSVQQLLDLKKTGYLRWVYYSCSKISFTYDILKEIGVITDKYDDRIEKPGTDIELWERLDAIKFNRLCYRLSPKHVMNRYRMGFKHKMRANKNKDKIFFSKRSMQSRNHGRQTTI